MNADTDQPITGKHEFDLVTSAKHKYAVIFFMLIFQRSSLNDDRNLF